MAFGSLPSVLGSGGGTAYSLIGGTGLFADGTAAAPSISFAADSDTGFYRSNPNQVCATIGGVAAAVFANVAGINPYIAGFIGGGYLQWLNSGGLNLTAGGTDKNITLTPSGTGFVSIPSLNYDLSSALFSAEIKYAGAFSAGRGGSLGLGGTYDGSNSTLFAGIAGVKESAVSGETGGTLTFHSRSNAGAISERARILSTGRFLLGTTTDSANGILQLASSTAASGGIGFGTDTQLYRVGPAALRLDAPAGDLQFQLARNGTVNGGFLVDGATLYVQTQIAGMGMIFKTAAGTTALTLDASQNATFAGTVKPQLATTAGAPAYVKGAIYFDTTLNKLRVGGAAAWETITSA